jgi:hypothetical protein
MARAPGKPAQSKGNLLLTKLLSNQYGFSLRSIRADLQGRGWAAQALYRPRVFKPVAGKGVLIIRDLGA